MYKKTAAQFIYYIVHNLRGNYSPILPHLYIPALSSLKNTPELLSYLCSLNLNIYIENGNLPPPSLTLDMVC